MEKSAERASHARVRMLSGMLYSNEVSSKALLTAVSFLILLTLKVVAALFSSYIVSSQMLGTQFSIAWTFICVSSVIYAGLYIIEPAISEDVISEALISEASISESGYRTKPLAQEKSQTQHKVADSTSNTESDTRTTLKNLVTFSKIQEKVTRVEALN